MTPMKAATVAGSQLTTPEFRVSFPSVFVARAAVEGQEPKFSVTMLFAKTTDLTPLKIAAKAAIISKWGEDQAKWPKNLRLPFRDGSEKEYDGYEGTTFCTASSKMRPGLVDHALQPIIEPSEFYGGCYARATISMFAYDVSGNRGVGIGLRNIQKIRDGEPFSGRNKAEKDFDAIAVPPAGGNAAVDPLAGIGA